MTNISKKLVDTERLGNAKRAIPFVRGFAHESASLVQTGFQTPERGPERVNSAIPRLLRGPSAIHSGPVAEPAATRSNANWMFGKKPMNARFWLSIGNTYVKLTLKPGQSYILHHRHPEQSGYTEAREVYRNLGNGFVYHGWSQINDRNILGGFNTLRLEARRTPGFSHPVL